MFSRQFDVQNKKYWNLYDILNKQIGNCNNLKDKSFIIDCEVVYVNEKDELLPFQDMERRLEETVTNFKLSIEDNIPTNKFPKLFAFDLLALNEESVCHLSLNERRELLSQLIEDNPTIKLAERFDFPNTVTPSAL